MSLTPEQQRVRIAEACGRDVKRCYIHHKHDCCGRGAIPDYLNSLDAIAEAERALLTTNQKKAHYLTALLSIVESEKLAEIEKANGDATYENWKCDPFDLFRSTASQRATALLRVIEDPKL